MHSQKIRALKKSCKPFFTDKKIFDIILFGSTTRGKTRPRDTDLAILYTTATAKEMRETTYQIRKTLEKKELQVEITELTLQDLFSPTQLSRQGIIAEGYSLKHSKPFHQLLGFTSYQLFTYNLKNLTHKEKTRFTHALKGRRGAKGISQKLGCQHLAPGCILVPIQTSDEFKEFLNQWKLNHTSTKILKETY